MCEHVIVFPRQLYGRVFKDTRCSYAGFLNNQLSSTMLVGIEVAVEYWLALSHSPQAQWLRYSDPSGCLLVGRLRRFDWNCDSVVQYRQQPSSPQFSCLTSGSVFM